ncbi:MAG: tRNA uridine-5-carboxymethylaminomethyl(34) synthesis GTPase MnmE [Elusimicrobia bacterium]|nr:tRNA uridine-5-carboxymethylaminomethyl(34) synthesis GTPase MnmE [Elusimicrobiota bacterium]
MDTIAAIATPLGAGALGIVRLSGDRAFEVAASFFKSAPPIIEADPWQVLMGKIMDPAENNIPSLTPHPSPLTPSAIIDWAVAVKYAAPKSYTGENSVEITCHGSPLILRTVLKLALAAGAREALPGEFTQRAYLNGKMDLVQAEAICGMIRSSSERAGRLQARILSGSLSAQIKTLAGRIIDILAAADVLLDHPDEPDITDSIRPQALKQSLEKIREEIGILAESFRQSHKIREGLNAVIVGAPNAGKSTLLNALLVKNRAIVSSEPGTTRDTLEEMIEIDGYLIRFIDTAGWRRRPEGDIEALGLERTCQAISAADVLIWVIDGARHRNGADGEVLELIRRESKPAVIVWNKKDAPGFCAGKTLFSDLLIHKEMSLSALRGEGLRELKESLKEYVNGLAPRESETPVLEERQASLLHCAGRDAVSALENLKANRWELVGLELRHGANDLNMMLGEGAVSDEILRSIFSKFCIGK